MAQNVISDNRLIYHYRDLYGLKGILESRKFFATRIGFLNDSSELIYGLRMFDKIFYERYGVDKELFEFMKGYTLKTAFDCSDFYVISFSYNQDSLALWANYTQYYGYNIGFDKSELVNKVFNFCRKKRSEENISIYAYDLEICYSEEEQLKLLEKHIDELHELYIDYKENKSIDRISDIAAKTVLQLLSIKNPEYRIEEEFRIVIIDTSKLKPDFKYENNLYKYRESQNAFFPYIEIDIGDIKSTVNCITMGPKHIDIAEEGLRFFLLKNNLENIKVAKSTLPVRF